MGFTVSNICDMDGLPIEFMRREVTGKFALWRFDDYSGQFILHDSYDTELAARTILEARAFGIYHSAGD